LWPTDTASSTELVWGAGGVQNGHLHVRRVKQALIVPIQSWGMSYAPCGGYRTGPQVAAVAQNGLPTGGEPAVATARPLRRSVSAASFPAPKILEPCRRQFSVAHRVLDVAQGNSWSPIVRLHHPEKGTLMRSRPLQQVPQKLPGAMPEGFINTAREGFRTSASELLSQFGEFSRLLCHHFKLPSCMC
jgi:hypothetical protein